MGTIRCPHCGSPVMVRGSRWECGYCGDFGLLSSLRPAEREKIEPGCVQISITITEDELEPEPRQLSRQELEDMVLRGDPSERAAAEVKLLLAAFPQAASRWSRERQQEMDEMDIICETGEDDPQTAVQMMRLLLDLVGERLQEPQWAQEILGGSLYDACMERSIQGILLREMDGDDRLARQIFLSAYWGYPQEDLIEACDWYGKAALKERLLGYQRQNPYCE